MRTEPPLATVHPAWGPAQAVTAQSEAWLVHPSDDVAYLLSLIGSAHALDTIRRAFLEDTIVLDLTPPRGLGRRLSALRSGAWHYRAWRGRLPSGAVHLVLAAARAPDAPEGPRLVLARSAEALPAACVEVLTHKEALMALPAWAPWLFRRLVAEQLAVRLAGPRPGPVGVLLHAGETDLDRLVTEGLRQGALAFPGDA